MSKKILIVDDEEDIRSILRFELEDLGCEVEDTDNGADALEQLKSRPFDIVFTDMNMPKMNGLTLLTEIHKLPLSPRPWLIAVSGDLAAHYSPEEQATLAKLIDGSVQKPFSSEQLQKLFDQLTRPKAA